MNITAMKLAMKDSISDVLEQMFFLPIDILEDDTGADANIEPQNNSLITAAVGFEGTSNGLFVLTIPSNLAGSMAIDFLGTSPEMLSSDQITETVKEMINMLAGSTLSAYEPESAFNLQIPVIIAPSQPIPSSAKLDASIELLIETLESRMRFRLNIIDDGSKA
jgi:CheY-specific phosphatase CheX